MAKLIILRGNSASGKTTVAKELQKKFGRNTMLISQDAIRWEMLWVKDRPENEAIPLMQALLKYGYAHNEVVILEGIMYAEWYNPLFELAGQLYGTDIYAYYFDLSFEETARRHQTRLKCNDFGAEDMRKWWREKDFSDVLEEVAITADKDVVSIVSDIYGAVTGLKETE